MDGVNKGIMTRWLETICAEEDRQSRGNRSMSLDLCTFTTEIPMHRPQKTTGELVTEKDPSGGTNVVQQHPAMSPDSPLTGVERFRMR